VTPPSNPFVGLSGSREEIWALGLRNPWRFSFDRQTGDLYIADVGQNTWEEVDFQKAGSGGGQNYGWNTMEALACYQADSCDTNGKVLPVIAYGHDQGCSITGGYVYRGRKIPALAGTYLYGDYCSGTLWGLRPDSRGDWQSSVLLASGANISSFGEDEQGELYVLDLKGQVYRLVEKQ
jgi:glucose/arabinose dehydrogenase